MDKLYTIDDLTKAYELGVDYGLLIAEQERDSEDVFDAFCCGETARRMCVPSTPARRRQPRSQEWREVMGSSPLKFIELAMKGQS